MWEIANKTSTAGSWQVDFSFRWLKYVSNLLAFVFPFQSFSSKHNFRDTNLALYINKYFIIRLLLECQVKKAYSDY